MTNNDRKLKLWNKNFIFVVLGTIISAIGGMGLNIALGILVFEETQSTALVAVFTAASFIPHLILPILIGPIVDKNNPLKLLLKNETILAILYFIATVVAYKTGFNYTLFLIFSILISSFGVVSNLSSSSIFPQIIQKEHYVKGNAILNTIYPLCDVFVTPVVVFLFYKFGITPILGFYAVATVIDVLIESRIDYEFEYEKFEKKDIKSSFVEFKTDLKDGFNYYINDPAIKAVFTYVMLSTIADAASLLIYPFFSSHPTYTVTNYALLMSIKSAGYMMGGFLHYFFEISDKKRFAITILVYSLFTIGDAAMLFLPFVVMCILYFILGIAGMNSANIRVSAIAQHVPVNKRAKINSFFTVMYSLARIIGEITSGALGEVFTYESIRVFLQIIPALGIIFILLPRKNKVRELYNYSTKTDK